MSTEAKTKNESSQAGEIINIDLKAFLVPAALIISSCFLSTALFLGLNNVSNALDDLTIKSGSSNTTTTATTDTTATGNANAVTQEQIQALFNDDALVLGDPDSDVLIAEFSDPSCPYCHIAGGHNPELNSQVGTQFVMVADGGTYVAPVPEFKKLVDDGKAAFVLVYTNGHGNGRLSAQALYCAYEKNKFWEVHDLMMTAEGYALINDTVKNDVANADVLADFLSDKIDSDFMQDCLESGKYEGRITDDEAIARSVGVNGTPGFFVNTTNFAGAYSYTDMEPVIKAALE